MTNLGHDSPGAYPIPKWNRPAPLGYGNAVDSVVSVAAPLLAGFSLTSVIVLADDSDHFRWPGLAILALTLSAILMVVTVQCGFNARQYFWSPADVTNWWPDMTATADRERMLRNEHSFYFARWCRWSDAARRSYNLGIVALLMGLGAALPPPEAANQPVLRWISAGLAFAACLGECVWIVINSERR